jgi:catechol 2,3-dioxygenase-like lactoylglutathione lyase family enzyme
MDRQVDHVTMNVADADAARDFYRSALGELGLSESTDPRGRVEYGRGGRSDFGFYTDPENFYQHAHIAFTAASREEVDRFFAAAIAHGGSVLDAPRERPEFGLYSAYVRDPEGNGVEVACRLGSLTASPPAPA